MYLFSFLIVLAFPAGLGFLIWLLVRPTPERDAAAAHAWANFHTYTTAHRWQLLYVHDVYQNGHNGSKAHVSIYDDPAKGQRDSWFWWHHVQAGSVVAVNSFGEGWGPHTGKNGVLYIGDEHTHQSGVQATFAAAELARARRHWSRQQPHLAA
ncbi:hypothetical protein ACM0CU_24130 [Mycobacteroides abscessus subsp. abscessus]|uniref:hypothetical protein n=1 Tax=Mycobacteroides abscessus TaxID=36809 RepID=UPI0039F0EA3C